LPRPFPLPGDRYRMPLQLLSPRSAALPRRHDRPKARLLARVPGHPGLNAERRLKVANIQIVNSWEYHGDPSRTSVESATIPHFHPRGEGVPLSKKTISADPFATGYGLPATSRKLPAARCSLPAAGCFFCYTQTTLSCLVVSRSAFIRKTSSRILPSPLSVMVVCPR